MTRLFLCLCGSLALAAQEPAPDPIALQGPVPFPRRDDSSRFVDLFRPPQTQVAALSPDGAHLAYSFRQNDKLSVVVVDAADPATVRTRVLVAEDRTSTPRFSDLRESTPARITWMRWVTPTRLVVATNTHVPVSASGSRPGVILAFDADGSNARLLATSRDLRELLTRGTREFRGRLGGDDDFFPSGFFANDETSDTGTSAESSAEDELGAGGSELGALAPHVVDLDPSLPGSILLRTAGMVSMTVWRLDTATGKASAIHENQPDPSLLFLFDRQGRPRISAPALTSRSFPHRLRLEDGPGAKRSRDLTTAAGLGDTPGFVVSPENFFGERAIPLGFDEKPEILYYASNIGRDTYGIYSVDLATGRRTGLAIENRGVDLIGLPEDPFGLPNTLVYDRYTRQVAGIRLTDRFRTTRWLSSEFQAIQALLEKSLPGRNVDIFDWNADRTRFLAATSGPTDSGGLVLLDGKTMQVREFARRAPWLDAVPTNRTMSFTVETQPGLELACRLTFSPNARVKPQPLIVVCPSVPWERLPVEFQAEVQAVASMGFAVAQPASRGAWGYGIKRRETIHEGYDSAQVADLVRITDEIAKLFTVDPKRVGLVGAGHGAFVALRAMQLHPERFRCAVAIEPIVDLGGWLARESFGSRDAALQLVRSYYGPPARLEQSALVREADRIVKPLLIFSYPGEDGAARRYNYLAANSFARSVRRPSAEVDFEALSQEFTQDLPHAKAGVYRQIEDFLNTHVYDFGIKIGEQKTIPEAPAEKQ